MDDSQRETVRVPLPEQRVAGRYRLLERVAGGGMGMVFIAETIGVGTRVAIKFLDPEPTPDLAKRVDRFLLEAQISQQVRHPGAALLLDFGKDEQRGYLYLVFEYVDGEDLRALLTREGRLSFEEARTIALKVAEPLAFAHSKGIVHRDVKPENVRVRRDLSGPHVKVLDFGIARLVGAQGIRLTAEGHLAGTPRYMAPEQVKDGPIDARTDVYALGLVFYEMLAGQPAFDGGNYSKVMLKQVLEPLPELGALAPDRADPHIDQLLRRACAKDMAQRFESIADFAAALRELKAPAWSPPSARPQAQVPAAGFGSPPGTDAVHRTAASTLRVAVASTQPLSGLSAPVGDSSVIARTVVGLPIPKPGNAPVRRARAATWLALAAAAMAAAYGLWRLY